MTFLTNITYNKIIEGKKILNICERKLEKFSFMDNKDFESPGLRKYLLVSNLSNLALNIINLEKEYNFRNNIKQNLDNRSHISKPNMFDDFNRYKTRDDTKNNRNVEYKTIVPDYDDDEEFLDDFYEEDEESSEDDDDDDESSQEIYVITNSSHDNNNNGYHRDTLECYENNEEEEDTSKEKVLNADTYMEDLRDNMSSVVVSVASKNIHEISVSNHLGKHSLNLGEEIITSTVAYKKVKHI